jgi:hypothetical protein
VLTLPGGFEVAHSRLICALLSLSLCIACSDDSGSSAKPDSALDQAADQTKTSDLSDSRVQSDSQAGECTWDGKKSCGDTTKYCDDSIGNKCVACPSGRFNCDHRFDCECTQGCNGDKCKYPDCSAKTGCGDVALFCEFGDCFNCAPNTFNCDGAYGCECADGCDGTKCKGGTSVCSFEKPGACGGDDKQWCYQDACNSCAPGRYNCNNVKGCECDEVGCNGQKCAGKCTGNECP